MASFMFLGFLLGIRHALEADHLATVASLSTQTKASGELLKQGFAWGLGHSLTILLFAGGMMWLGSSISSRIATNLETVVGILMLFLGFDVVRKTISAHNHMGSLKHAHDKASYPLKALSLGLIHGLAGSAAILILVAEKMESVSAGFLYLGLFCVGSIAGMLAFSALICMPVKVHKQLFESFRSIFQFSIGAITFGLGAHITYSGLAV